MCGALRRVGGARVRPLDLVDPGLHVAFGLDRLIIQRCHRLLDGGRHRVLVHGDVGVVGVRVLRRVHEGAERLGRGRRRGRGGEQVAGEGLAGEGGPRWRGRRRRACPVIPVVVLVPWRRRQGEIVGVHRPG